jgi:hypothetical protein
VSTEGKATELHKLVTVLEHVLEAIDRLTRLRNELVAQIGQIARSESPEVKAEKWVEWIELLRGAVRVLVIAKELVRSEMREAGGVR